MSDNKLNFNRNLLNINMLNVVDLNSTLISNENDELSKDLDKLIFMSSELSKKILMKDADVVFDGNISLDGFSDNLYLNRLQKDFEAKMQEISKLYDVPPINKTSSNAILTSVFSIEDKEENYYQSIDIQNIDNGSSRKIYNILFQPKYLLSIVRNSFFLGKSIVEQDLVTFFFSLVGLLLDYGNATQIKLSKNQIIVLLYLAKYSYFSLSEDDLIQHIQNKELNFSNSCINDKDLENLGKNEIVAAVTELAEIKVLSIIEGKIKLIEKVSI